MALGEAFYTTISFKEFCTIKHLEWYEPQLAEDEESLKNTGQKLNEREGQVDWLEANASSQFEKQVFAMMKRLQPLPQSKDSLLEILEQVASALSNVRHEPLEEMWEATHPSGIALVTSELLRHKDGYVSLMVATCISEITRISTQMLLMRMM